MDQGALVTMQIDEGQQLIDHLVAAGVPLTGAAWLKDTENDQWYLYLVTPLVSEDGATREAYRRVNSVRRKLAEPSGIHSLQIKVIAPTDPVAQAILDLRRRYPGKKPIPFWGSQLGGLSVDGAVIYSVSLDRG
jgi:hypothetical protein